MTNSRAKGQRVTLPIRIESEANKRENFWKVAARKKSHRNTALLVLSKELGRAPPTGHLVITLTRIAPRQLDDDNLASGFKAARDGVADWLGVDDGHPSLKWQYDQRKGGKGEYAAEVAIEAWAMVSRESL